MRAKWDVHPPEVTRAQARMRNGQTRGEAGFSGELIRWGEAVAARKTNAAPSRSARLMVIRTLPFIPVDLPHLRT